MALVDIDFNPDEKTLRSFGWIALIGFGAVAALAWFELLIFSFGLGAARIPVAATFAGLGLLAALLGLVYPKANRFIYVGLAVVAFPIGFVLSYVIMATLFYVIIAPIGLLLRLFGKDPLDRKLRPEARTYWVDAHPPRPAESYFKQF